MERYRDMIRPIVIFMFSLLSLTAFAQQKQLSKLEKWYHKGQYETCLERAEYFLIKYDEEPEMHVYAAISAMRMLRVQRNGVDTTLLASMLQHIRTAHLLDPQHKTFNRHRGDIKVLNRYIESYAEAMYNETPTNSADIHVLLATIFNDTTVAYRELFMPETLVQNVEVDTTENSAPQKPQNGPKPVPYADSLTAFAAQFTGTPYKYTGCDPNGFDCSGFVNYVYKHFGIEIPRTAKDIATIGKPISTKALQPGDILVFGYKSSSGKLRVQHVGMVHDVGEGSYFSIIHSVSNGVSIDGPMSNSWDHWTQRLLTVRRLPQVVHH